MTTLADTAKHAGVPLSTASYAMSGKRPIGMETRRRLFAAVEELRFPPHTAARTLASKRSRTVALSCPTRDSDLSMMPLEFGRALARDFLDGRSAVTAVIAITPEAVAGVVRAAHDRGVAIPDDLSLVVVASPQLAALRTPPLTTIDFPAAEMGRQGIELLIDQLEGGDRGPRQRRRRAGLTVRRGTGPAPGAG